MRRKRTAEIVMLLSAVLLFSLTLSRPVAASPQDESKEVIQRLNDALIQAMKGGAEMGYSGRFKLLKPVIEESFALPFIARVSLGGFWAGLTEEERQLLIQLYTEWSVASYAAQFDEYSGEKFEVLPVTRTYSNTVIVSSNLITSTEIVAFNYHLIPVERKMRIVDVKVSGVSQLALTRSQFVSIMERKGFDGLISTLKEKTANLAGGQ